MHLRPLLVCLAAAWLAGCELLPDSAIDPRESMTPASPSTVCYDEIPDFDNEACLFPEWVDFGLAAQRGDRDWRGEMLERLEGGGAERRLARAMVLSWGSERQWDQAAELYKSDMHAAPAALQPLLQYWLNELEGRRAMAARLAEAGQELEGTRQERDELETLNDELTKKLEALTAIERSMNLRQQTE
ncbi:hypothetical protein [Halomonas urumqiensis]|uniref:YfhG lipoprotein n=1 Tax=Halomonas urumqiensis TaxID=1684789 RepID=A0A2N7UPE1_9GAMM|nr:hypothetical protein [Halomonas urumqiensis]PMR82290.1 hypothetical protein C1H70_03285 [Halomonas urumqiensis]PTB04247.1 hypothetical protein C6V82_00230 [Halomonas urumqiensis]GHE20879.1 hypothetical protein GCM10017767_14000 [Halomonas urumqiensis]